MQEKQVTIGDTTYPLPAPFLCWPRKTRSNKRGLTLLPEAQVDRFMLKLSITYPTREEERGNLEKKSVAEKKYARSSRRTAFLDPLRVKESTWMKNKELHFGPGLCDARPGPFQFKRNEIG